MDLIEGRLPAVITVSKGSAAPRFATLSGWMNAMKTPIGIWGVREIEADPAKTGLDGSPTRVVEIFAPPVRGGGVKLDCRENPEQAVQAILGALRG